MVPLCFVLMPAGKRSLASGSTVDFDAVYRDLIVPAIASAAMEPLRADQELFGEIVTQAMFEQLVLCDYAIAELTGANANILYGLGLRHGMRPATTVPIYAAAARLPLDIMPTQAMPYRIDATGKLADVQADCDRLRDLLSGAMAARARGVADSALFRLVEHHGPLEVARLKTDTFRERSTYAVSVRERLRQARSEGKAAVAAVAATLGDIARCEAGVVVDLMLSYRAVGDMQAIVDLHARMSAPLKRAVMVREQLGFALNRLRQFDHAEQVLHAVIAEYGDSSETNSLLGRLYKDRREAAISSGDQVAAGAWLAKAIDAYLRGFESDWRDAYPGVNTVTLMELASPPDPRRGELLPVVTYAVKRRIAQGAHDYWDHATLIELAVLARDEAAARAALIDALAAVRERWEPETTARNLRLLREARAARGEVDAWPAAIEAALNARAKG